MPTPEGTGAAQSARAVPAQAHGRQMLVIYVALMLAMLLAALDQAIVSTALPTIVSDLGGLSHLSWVVTAFPATRRPVLPPPASRPCRPLPAPATRASTLPALNPPLRSLRPHASIPHHLLQIFR